MKEIGILGGGQLGLMLYQHSISYPVTLHFLDSSTEAPCAKVSPNFSLGNYTDYQTVLDFGEKFNTIGIEIEQVNLQALKELKAKGKRIIPDPDVLAIIQDKAKQKQFYLENNIPAAPLVEKDDFPNVQKVNMGGYDGKGVMVNKSQADLENALLGDSFYEQKADIDKELAVLVAKDKNDKLFLSPVVEQVFDEKYNLVDYLLCPSSISDDQKAACKKIASKMVAQFVGEGLFAIELFLNKDGSIWVNETAPRLHNSGHVGMEAWTHSQFDWYLRLLMDLPLAETAIIKPAAMLNVIGKEEKLAEFNNIEKIAKQSAVYFHWYQKSQSKAGRKLGHLNLFAENTDELKQKIKKIKDES